MKKEQNSLKSIVYQKTLDGIIQGEYKAGQIINEQELVEKFGCSKAPVREALIALCNEGVLRSIPRYGYEVIRLTGRDVAEILRYRLILESGLLMDGFRNITEEQFQALEELDRLCNASVDDMWEHWDYNARFHLALVSCSGNTYAQNQLKKSMDILKRAYAQFYWDKWDARYNPVDMRHHQEILSCLRSGDIEGAVQALDLDFGDFTRL
ncbi:MAG: GntR family transcriptional regulator [Eubacteriales bacterium]|nr:GntR family transcriptional regulator [Eubacteriales bacterium]